MPLALVLEGLAGRSEGGDQCLPGDGVGTELYPGDLLEQVGRDVDGGGLGDYAGRSYKYYIERRKPRETFLI